MRRASAWFAAGAAAVVLAGCSAGSPSATATSSAPAGLPPLTASLGTGTATWVAVPMGHLNDPENTFWELFVRQVSGPRWALVTPPGVADNGGLVLAAAPGSAVVAFRPSQSLSFSPVATTTDGGRTYLPGLIPSGVADAPAAVAAGAAGAEWALTDGGADVLGRASATGAWTTRATAAGLARLPGAKSCGVTKFSGVTLTSAGAVLGSGCSRPGVAGVFEQTGTGFAFTGPNLPAAANGSMADVVRLTSSPAGLAVLVRLRSGNRADYEVAWRPTGSSGWTWSSPLTVPGRLVSTSTSPAGGFALVATTAAGVLEGSTIAAGGPNWNTLPVLPNDAAVVTVDGRRTDALAVTSGTFTDYLLGAGGTWVRTQTIDVSIPYGSSG
jgi:hypothetical protein